MSGNDRSRDGEDQETGYDIMRNQLVVQFRYHYRNRAWRCTEDQCALPLAGKDAEPRDAVNEGLLLWRYPQEKIMRASPKHQKAARLDAGSEETALFNRLNQRKPSTKEIESTLPGQPSTVVESWLPSFFELYPRVLKAYRHSGGLELLRACDYMIRTGDPSEMNRLTAEHSPPPEVIVIEDEQDYLTPALGSFHWQADGGACGWLDYEPYINQVIEAARVEGGSHVCFSIRGQRYRLDLKRMLQVNLASSTARPVRMVSA